MKKKLLTLIILLIAHFSWVRGQDWSFYKDLPVNVSPVDIDINNAGTLFMLSADNRFFYKTVNGSWQEMVNGSLAAPVSPLNISCQKNSNRIFVGDSFSGGIFYTSDFGQNWNQTFLTTNSVTGFHEPLYELSEVISANNFFGGSSGDNLEPLIIRYTNQGQSGQIFEFDPNNNPDNTPAELLFTSDYNLLIGTVNGGIWLSQDNGESYQQTNFTQHEIYRFAEDAESGRVYALGHDLTQDELFLIYSDDYLNWEYMNLPNNNERYTCLFFDDTSNSLWIGSESGIYKMSVNGNTQIWSNTLFNNSSQFSIEIIADTNGNIYNFSKNYIAQKLTNGNSWVQQNQGLKGTITTLLFDNNNHIYSSNLYSSTISFATNQTAPWENQVIGNITTMNQIFKTSDNIIYASKSNQLLKSVDSGVTYTVVPNPSAFPTLGLVNYHVADDGTLFAMHNFSPDVLYASNNAGQSWYMVYDFDPEATTKQIQNISKDNTGRLCVTLLNGSIGSEEFLYSLNNGVTWQSLTTPESLLFSPTGRFYAKGNETYFILDGQKLYKFISESTVQLVEIQLPFTPYFTTDRGISNFKINQFGHFFFFSGFELYVSKNKGITWTNLGIPQELNPELPYIEDYNFDAQGDAYAIVNSAAVNIADRGIYKVTQLLSVDDTDFESVRIYPNPAKNIIYFNGDDRVKDIQIFDVTGKKVLDVANWNSNSIDIEFLSSGLYLMLLSTERGVSDSIKFIKE